MRQSIIVPEPNAPARDALCLIRDEPRLIKVIGSEGIAMALTISETEGGDPVIEIPGTGEIVVRAESVQILREGLRYHYNIWDRRDPAALILLAKGAISFAASIKPSGADLATTLFENGQGFISCTAAQYAALAIKDPNTLYVVR